MNDPIRSTLEPLVRAAGVNATARAIGVTGAALVRWFGGRGSISPETQEKLAAHLGYRIVPARIEKMRAGKQRA